MAALLFRYRGAAKQTIIPLTLLVNHSRGQKPLEICRKDHKDYATPDSLLDDHVMGANSTRITGASEINSGQGNVNGILKGTGTRPVFSTKGRGFWGQTSRQSEGSFYRTAKVMSHLSRAKIPQGLSSEQRHVYQVLLGVAAARAKRDTPHIVVITDLAKDYDDLAALVVLKELHRLELVHLEGFIANLAPAEKRARFGRGALDSLGLPDVPVAEGLPASDKPRGELDYEFNCSFMASEDWIPENGDRLLLRLCHEALEQKRKLTLLCLSPLTDIANFAEEHPTLLKSVLHNVVLQGGYSLVDGRVRPDKTAANNHVNMIGAENFHTFLQENNIPSTVYNKDAAFATPMTSKLFATLAETKHPVGEHLRYVQVEQDLQFYEKACLPEDQRFAPYYDQEYFLRKRSTWFDTHTDLTDAPKGREIVPYLEKVILYDALSALGASGWDVIQALKVVSGLNRDSQSPLHKVVAGEEASPGVNGNQMASVLSALLLGSILSYQQGLPSDTSRNT